MGFDVSDDLQQLLDKASAFVETSIYPIEQEAIEDFAAAEPKLNALRNEVKAMGMWAPQMPREMGGMGLSFLDHARLVEVLARSPLGLYVFGCPAPDAGNMEILHKFGTPEQQTKWLKPLVDGDIRSCFSMTEPDHAGSNPTWLGTTAVREGDEYVINGHKIWTSYSDIADWCLLLARTDPDVPRHRGISAFIVPMDTPGIVQRPLKMISGITTEFGQVTFDDVRVPAGNIVGQPGDGWAMAMTVVGHEREPSTLGYVARYAKTVQSLVSRADEPNDELALAAVETEMLRLHVRRRLSEQLDGVSHSSEGSLDKLLMTWTEQTVGHAALSVTGTSDPELLSSYLYSRAQSVMGGTSQIQKNIIAGRLLGLGV